jgi:hypothetical protein
MQTVRADTMIDTGVRNQHNGLARVVRRLSEHAEQSSVGDLENAFFHFRRVRSSSTKALIDAVGFQGVVSQDTRDQKPGSGSRKVEPGASIEAESFDNAIVI